MNFSWAEMPRNLEISFKYSVEATENTTTLCKLHMVSKGFRPMNALTYRVFSHDVMAAILVSQTSPERVELFSCANAFFCSDKFAYMLSKWVKTLY